ncbi:MAG: hypothetical protein GF311_12580 [Candidatus Lokiarchaeota archaeon]|nr:hypothetical protein [Candidatus Lokiarchaeota archaeon]
MKIYFQYNAKSRGQNIPRANKIADDVGYKRENSFKIIQFSNPRDPRLLELARLIGGLKGSVLFIKEKGKKEILNSQTFFKTISCEVNHFCDGLCKHISIGKLSLQKIYERYGHRIDNDILTQYNDGLIKIFGPFLTQDTPYTYILDKEAILDHIKSEMISEQRFCEKYDQNLVIKRIGDLPRVIRYVPLEALKVEFSKKYLSDEFECLGLMLGNVSLDGNLTPEQYTEAIKGIEIIKLVNYPIENSNIWISINWYTKSKEIVFWKLKSKEYNINDMKMETSLTIEDGIYTINTPIARIYFIIKKVSDESLDSLVEKLKRV